MTNIFKKALYVNAIVNAGGSVLLLGLFFLWQTWGIPLNHLAQMVLPRVLIAALPVFCFVNLVMFQERRAIVSWYEQGASFDNETFAVLSRVSGKIIKKNKEKMTYQDMKEFKKQKRVFPFLY